MFRNWAKLTFKLTAYVLRRTKASIMHECEVDVNTILMVWGNTQELWWITISSHQMGSMMNMI